ncbi:ead/Ea22-like family protein [Edwardsiella tarda]|uniref:ead/Ea22-like family protein n=1 Tax=Edwardsiella tarda TaxID=636 RepID=UPI00351BF305
MAAMTAFGVMMNKVDKQALRQLAINATNGTWRYLKTTPFMISAENNTRVVNLLDGDVTKANSEFIAAANPATMLALLDENDELAAENYRMKVAINQQIKLKAKIKNSGTPPHPDFWIQSICEAEDNVLRAIGEVTETDAFINEMRAKGVESCAAWLQGGCKYSRMAEMLREFARNMREGKA